MGTKYLQPLDDEAADAAYVTATDKGDRHSELLVLICNLQAQVNGLDERVTDLES
jgi:hypothetical protein